MALATAKPEDTEAEKAAAAEPKRGRKRIIVIAGGLAAALVVGVGGFIGYKKFLAPPPPAPPPAKSKAPTPAPTAKVPTATKSQPTPSDTMNKVAHAPANAINKAQEAIAARSASGQDKVDAAAAGEEVVGKQPGAKSKATTATTSIAPGITATMPVDAAAEASPAFKSFVANAKISGVVATRAIVNGRLVRAGEIIDAGLHITFEGYDAEKKQLLFRDGSGATVARRFR